MVKELLPVGSVVLLNGGTKKTVIMGIMQFGTINNEKISFDYVAVPYPEGFIGLDTLLFFNHLDINEVVFDGHDDAERRNLIQMLSENPMDDVQSKLIKNSNESDNCVRGELP